MEEISVFVSRALDKVGYSSTMVNFRRSLWQQYALQENNLKYHRSGRHLLIAGSKAEGVSAYYESDIDHMFVLKYVVCVENADDHLKNDVTCFLRDNNDVPPGYTKLRLIKMRQGISSKLIRNSLFEDKDNNKYISSACFMAEQQNVIDNNQRVVVEQNAVSYGNSSGPAFPLSASGIKADIVTGFFCEHPSELYTWQKRRRNNGWPNAGVIEDITSRGCQLVPTGCRDSELQFEQWRLCFIDSELQLMQSLNDTQIKLYVILKQITKDVLKTICAEITSFMIKNVCYWMAELIPADVFKEQKLLEIALYSLTFLKYCIARWNFLPYYMIPQRNLLVGKIPSEKRQQIECCLESLVIEGPQLLLRCTKIRSAMLSLYQVPGQLRAYSRKRDALEILKLFLTFFAIAKEYDVKTGDLCDELRFKMADIVLPERKFMRHMGIAVNETIMERINLMLS